MRISSAQAKKIADPQSFSVLFQLGREVAGIALALDVAFRSEIFHQRALDLGPIGDLRKDRLFSVTTLW
jgi:hypothetical protein